MFPRKKNKKQKTNKYNNNDHIKVHIVRYVAKPVEERLGFCTTRFFFRFKNSFTSYMCSV